MIHRSVVCSDEYIDLSFEAQSLYIQLTVEADNFGFVGGVKRIMRSIGVTETAMEELTKARFVIPFDSGVLVVRHWLLGNGQFKGDRIYESKYPRELSKVFVDADFTYGIQTEDSGFQTDSPITITSTSTKASNIFRAISSALHQQGICKESSSSVSSSSSASVTASVIRGNARARVREGESPDDDTDPAAEDAVTYEEYLERTFPGRLKELLGWWTGFREISVREIREYLSKGISPELLLWAASHAVDAGAASPRSYLRCVLEDKQEIDAVTLARLLEVEGDDQRERESIWRIAKKVSELREQIENEWHQMRGER